MPAPRFLINVPGGLQQVAASATGGVGNEEKVVSTNNAGVLDPSLFPAGIGKDIVTIPASEALAAGDSVNIHVVSGAARVRKSDSATANGGKKADGFVLSVYASGGLAQVYRSGLNSSLTGLSPGLDYYMGPSGTVTTVAPTAAGQTQQFLGKAISATTLDVQIAPFVGLA